MHELPKIPYDYKDLEPHIDEQTMEIHHTKHHQAYIDKLNGAIKGTDFENMNINELLQKLNDVPEDIRIAVRNNGGGHANHSLFWQLMGPGKGGDPSGAVADAIKQTFESFDKFKETFTDAAMTRFGSGWVWLMVDKGQLVIKSSANQDTPVMSRKTPVLGLDVWEHSYYLKYQNRRPDYVTAWWNVVNWDKVNELFEKAK